ncbi:uncharacterized protein EV422DRAFT_524332 [Fimicolochytrium jonesii]|uniref:uncharacterized protein n=1 Tax=Fimicolochytrium jonesii TaxID=1396493 RepID=UPI0022FDC493|nr:uncharacterized protein EV422DRAFT_524332 [Fimicolochytrium jonesii]KAI8822531.1 hypothetical protein EV422DRAFT_524332 [Fimicolochytrium jonesii]
MNTAGRQLFVGNLPFIVGWQDLKDLFRDAGNVVRADVVLGPAGRSRGFGTVTFSTPEEAQTAISLFNGREWHNRNIEVREDRNAGKVYGGRPPIGQSGSIAIGNAPILNRDSQEAPIVNIRALYVGNIPYTAAWQDLKELFNEAGQVFRAEVATDERGRSRGYGTLLMASVEDAQKAVDLFNGYEWKGRRIDVREDRSYSEGPRAVNNAGNNNGPSAAAKFVNAGVNGSASEANGAVGTTFANAAPTSTAGRQLFVGNLPFTVQWQELKDLFREVGNVLRADVTVDNQGRSRGYGQIVMSTVEDAQAAIDTLNGRDINGRAIEVREDKFAAENNGNLAGTQVFVGNLPYSLRWQDVKDIFRPHGLNPVHADVLVEHNTGRSKGCGVVRFQSPEEAERAVNEVNGELVSGRNIVVRLDKFA